MTTTRSYRTALSTDVALEEVRRNAGTQFDPRVAAVLVRLVEEGAIREVRESTLRVDAEPASASAGKPAL
jgi:HD-GYP domain-containing protein (c-di-GMP phosphodiesterase class II)